jgi:hypothetical protein
MPTVMANTRDTSTDLRNKYYDAMSKLKGLQSRIQQRAKEMVQKQPNIIVGYKMDQERTPNTVKELYDEYQLYIDSRLSPDMEFTTTAFLRIIEVIEKYNQEHSNIKQGKLFDQ